MRPWADSATANDFCCDIGMRSLNLSQAQAQAQTTDPSTSTAHSLSTTRSHSISNAQSVSPRQSPSQSRHSIYPHIHSLGSPLPHPANLDLYLSTLASLSSPLPCLFSSTSLQCGCHNPLLGLIQLPPSTRKLLSTIPRNTLK